MTTTAPLLSILIPSIPERRAKADALLAKLEAQRTASDTPLPVEILLLVDNRARTVGLKRQALLDIAAGDYVAFCDDDDDVAPDYLDLLCAACERGSDVVTFRQSATVNGVEGIVEFSLRHREDQPWKPGGVSHRRPWHVCAWRRELAQECVFTDKMFGEDLDWVEQAVPLARSESYINSTLQFYRYDEALSAAPPG